jgi:hypothetical protein
MTENLDIDTGALRNTLRDFKISSYIVGEVVDVIDDGTVRVHEVDFAADEPSTVSTEKPVSVFPSPEILRPGVRFVITSYFHDHSSTMGDTYRDKIDEITLFCSDSEYSETDALHSAFRA